MGVLRVRDVEKAQRCKNKTTSGNWAYSTEFFYHRILHLKFPHVLIKWIYIYHKENNMTVGRMMSLDLMA